MVNRLRDVLCGYFPALERAFDYAHSRGALLLLTGYQTPDAIRRIGQSRLRTGWASARSAAPNHSPPRPWPPPTPSTPSCPGRRSPPALWPTSRSSSWRSALGSPSWTDHHHLPVHPQAAIIESLPGMGPAWVRSWAPSSSPPQGT